MAQNLFEPPNEIIRQGIDDLLDFINKNKELQQYTFNLQLIRNPQKEFIFTEQLKCYEDFFREEYGNDVAKIYFGFHSTNTRNLDSINNKGLLSSYDIEYKQKLGNVIGKGTYIASTFNLAYSYGKRYKTSTTFVCLVLYGRSKKLMYKEAFKFYEKDLPDDCDSIQCDEQIVCRSSSMVLPIFVMSNIKPIINVNSNLSNKPILKVNSKIGNKNNKNNKNIKSENYNQTEILYQLHNFELNNIPLYDNLNQNIINLSNQISDIFPYINMGVIISIVRNNQNKDINYFINIFTEYQY